MMMKAKRVLLRYYFEVLASSCRATRLRRAQRIGLFHPKL
jgi:hypothetical protein